MGTLPKKKQRVRGLAPWRPSKESAAIVAAVQTVIDEYRNFLPITLRQIYYRLISNVAFPKTYHAYKGLGEKLNRARRAGMIDFDDMRDDGNTRNWPPDSYAGEAQLANTVAGIIEDFYLDRQRGQKVFTIVICEAAGMVPQLARVAHPFSIPVFSASGFDSTTAKRALALLIIAQGKCRILHLGDHDPSGVHMFSNLVEDVSKLITDLGGEVQPDFVRVAVTPDQIALYNLPTAPPNPKDKRSFSGQTTQCESLPPDVLATILEAAIRDGWDDAAMAAVDAETEEIKGKLLRRWRRK